MNLKKSNILLFSIIAISTSLTLVSCNKKNADIVEKNQIAAEEQTTTPKAETIAKETTKTEVAPKKEAVVEETKEQAKSNQLNIEDFGFELKDDFLYYKDTLISANKIVNYSIDAEKAKFNNSDGTSLSLSKDGSIEAKFPVGITLNIGPNLTNFILSYKNVTVKLPTIQNFTGNNDWYTITLSDNSNIKFNDTIVIITTDKISFTFNNDNVITKYENTIISNSNIKALDIKLPKINISYMDGSQLQQNLGVGTNFILENGYSIFNDENRTTFTANGETKILVGKLVSISQDTEKDSITFSTESDSYTLYLSNIGASEALNTNSLEANDTSLLKSESNALTSDSSISESKDQLLDNSKLINKEDKQEINVSLAKSDEIFDNSLISDNTIDKPFTIGLLANYTFFNGALEANGISNFTTFGLRADLVIEKEFLPNWNMGLELGFGADKFDTGFVKQFVPMFTIAHDFNLSNTKTLKPYLKVGVGSLIFINEKDLYPFFRAKIGGGIKYNFTDKLILNVGADYNFLYKSEVISHAFDAQVGLTYIY